MNPIQRESYKTKYIKMSANSDECKSNFQNDIASINIFDRLDKDLHADPNVNYKILESEISCLMNCHMKKSCKIQQKETQKRSLDNFWYLIIG